MRNCTPISSIMTKRVIALTREDDLEKADRLFKRYKIKHIPIVSREMVIGMLSYTDLMRISFAETSSTSEERIDTVVYNMFSIEQVMAKHVITVTEDTCVREASNILAKAPFHALPVVENGFLKGIVTTSDLLNYFSKQF
ncbi:CBS domain-containing protein [Tamlana fucoidanivorans]|uniref:CBS domain-containing protein n=1 Tax=Allotamlana fucoidanivorans TaxID=2583814 RepID=A0A5C4SLX6_9FLAO|nr:CBS domain-containing protein [Tamlana fucoidanivorans]TNJ44692.1 CBS domain-containing protein [Tamlana fucoidanivorans]